MGAGGASGAAGAAAVTGDAVGSSAGEVTAARGAAPPKWMANRSCNVRRAANPTITRVRAKRAVSATALDLRDRLLAAAAGDVSLLLLLRVPIEVGIRLPGTGVQESAPTLEGGRGNAGSTDV